jgi:hypothetical protein
MKVLVILALCVGSSVSLTAASQGESLGPNDTFRAAQLTKKEVEELLRQVEDSAFDTADDRQSELRVRRVDLGRTAGIIIQRTTLRLSFAFFSVNERYGDFSPVIAPWHLTLLGFCVGS